MLCIYKFAINIDDIINNILFLYGIKFSFNKKIKLNNTYTTYELSSEACVNYKDIIQKDFYEIDCVHTKIICIISF